MYKIAICDDNQEYLDLIGAKVQGYCEKKEVNVTLQYFRDSDLLAEYTEEKRIFDAYILDIEMPYISGVKLAEIIGRYSNSALIIFLTAHETYAVQACSMDIMGYVLKNQLDVGLKKVLDKLLMRLNQMKQHGIYIINNQRKYIKLLQQDIIYIYKYRKNAVFVLQGNKEECERITLQKALQKLNNPEMVVLDRGIILNLRHIQKIVDNRVKMDDGYELITSKVHINELKKCLSTYWGNTL